MMSSTCLSSCCHCLDVPGCWAVIHGRRGNPLIHPLGHHTDNVLCPSTTISSRALAPQHWPFISFLLSTPRHSCRNNRVGFAGHDRSLSQGSRRTLRAWLGHWNENVSYTQKTDERTDEPLVFRQIKHSTCKLNHN
jgi:hypothetical protein